MSNPKKFIDIHYHVDPDLYFRRYSAIEAGRLYKSLGGAVVLKSHLGSTAVQASLAQREGLPVFPSLVLNKIAGGIHYLPIMQALSEYQPVYESSLIVHLPTHTGRRHKSKLSRMLRKPEYQDFLFSAETVFDESYRLKPQITDILRCAVDYPFILSTGHASKNEIFELIEACDRLRVPKLLLNQPANPLTGLTADDLLHIANCYKFIWTEQTALTYCLGYQSKDDFYKVLSTVPRLIYSSDLGQTTQMDVAEWLTMSELWFLEAQLSEERRNEICLTNPSLIINL